MTETILPSGSGTWLRVAVLVIAGVETAALAFVFSLVLAGGALQSGESLARDIGWAILAIYGLPYLLCVVPALILTAFDRWLPLALGLCIAVVPLTLVTLHWA